MAIIKLDDTTAGRTYVAKITRDSDGYMWNGVDDFVADSTLTDAQQATAAGLATTDPVVSATGTHSHYEFTTPAGITVPCHIGLYLTSYAVNDREAYGADYDPHDYLVDLMWDELLTGASHNIATSAGRRLRQLGDAVAGTVVDTTPSATEFTTSLTQAADDFYADQIIYFTSGNLAGQSKPIASYDGATKTITADEAFTSAPANGDAFDILPVHVHPIAQIQSGLSTFVAATDEVTPTAASKTGYALAATGLDQISATPVANPTTWVQRINWVMQRFFYSSKTPTEVVVKDSAGATLTTQSITDDGAGTETMGPPTAPA